MLNLTKKNISSIAEAGYEFELVVPGEVEGSGAFITVRGAESKAVRSHNRKRFKEMQVREEKAKRSGKELKLEIEELEAMAVEQAIVRVISWRGIVLDDNQPELVFTPENAESVFKDHAWIRDKVIEESNEINNFRSE